MTDPHDYAGKYLRNFETYRYTFLERQVWLDRVRSILVPIDPEEFGDLSFWQAGMDWDKYATKARAVILRIGQNAWKDSEFEHNYMEAKRRHVAVGGYFFFDGRATPQQQANVIITAMQGKILELELFVDWEHDYGGASEGLPRVVELMQKVEQAGVQCKAVGMYTGYYWFIANSNATTNAAQYAYLRQRPLWLAWYAAASVVRVPPPWDTWTHWQYGTLAVDWGQPTSEIDMNRHNGTRSEFAARYPGGDTTPPDSGGTMAEWIVKAESLKIRSGPSVNYGQVQSLFQNDHLTGVLNTTYNWINISQITRVNGTVLTPGSAVSWWCSGGAAYVEPYTPPDPQPATDSIEIVISRDGVIVKRYRIVGTVEES